MAVELELEADAPRPVVTVSVVVLAIVRVVVNVEVAVSLCVGGVTVLFAATVEVWFDVVGDVLVVLEVPVEDAPQRVVPAARVGTLPPTINSLGPRLEFCT